MYEEYLSKKESNVYGLKYLPTLEPHISDALDFIPGTLEKINVPKDSGNGQFSKEDGEITLQEFNKVTPMKCIVEIGVATNFPGSSTEIFMSQKLDDCHYFGIDINWSGKEHHEQYKPNIHIVGMNSKDDREKIIEKLKEFGCEQIDVLMIDGDHSLNFMINDWKYVELVRSGGLILIHDLNVHPGPHLVWDSIDEEMFEKKKYFCDVDNDFGLGVVWKK